MDDTSRHARLYVIFEHVSEFYASHLYEEWRKGGSDSIPAAFFVKLNFL